MNIPPIRAIRGEEQQSPLDPYDKLSMERNDNIAEIVRIFNEYCFNPSVTQEDGAIFKAFLDRNQIAPERQTSERRAFPANISLSETIILKDILEMGFSPHEIAEILKGGHVLLHDRGAYYEIWSSLSSQYRGLSSLDGDNAPIERNSSHYRGEITDPQYGVSGALSHHILFGRVDNKTFFQLENTPHRSFLNIRETLGHLRDFALYRISHQNVGPYGYSKHCERGKGLQGPITKVLITK